MLAIFLYSAASAAVILAGLFARLNPTLKGCLVLAGLLILNALLMMYLRSKQD